VEITAAGRHRIPTAGGRRRIRLLRNARVKGSSPGLVATGISTEWEAFEGWMGEWKHRADAGEGLLRPDHRRTHSLPGSQGPRRVCARITIRNLV